MRQELSDDELACYVAIQDIWRELGAWPPAQMIAKKSGAKPDTVHFQMQRLVKKGWIDKVARGMYRFSREASHV